MALGERIPIQLSFTARDLVNRPENLRTDIHKAAKPSAISLIRGEHLARFTALTVVLSLDFTQTDLLHLDKVSLVYDDINFAVI